MDCLNVQQTVHTYKQVHVLFVVGFVCMNVCSLTKCEMNSTFMVSDIRKQLIESIEHHGSVYKGLLRYFFKLFFKEFLVVVTKEILEGVQTHCLLTF